MVWSDERRYSPLMACYKPVDAWQAREGGQVFFYEPRKVETIFLQLPCGSCIGCGLERSRQWAVRCMHEASLHAVSSFVTLTYDAEHLCADGSLNYSDFQAFMRRVRKSYGRVRFFVAGEYGSVNWRPHWHACLFGFRPSDLSLVKSSASGKTLYRSAFLEGVWPLGYSSVGDVTFDSAAYVARYCLKKISGVDPRDRYRRVDPDTGEVFRLRPEFCRMSLRPGIGGPWFDKYHGEVFPFDRVIVKGRECKPPRYYMTLQKRLDKQLAEGVEYDRYVKSLQFLGECTPERLADREKVTAGRLAFRKRSLEL